MDTKIQVAEEYECGIDTTEVMKNHVHMFVEVPPKCCQCRAAGLSPISSALAWLTVESQDTQPMFSSSCRPPMTIFLSKEAIFPQVVGNFIGPFCV